MGEGGVSRPQRPTLRYFGGKFMLRDWIVGNFHEHTIYTDSFGGGGSVLLAKSRSLGEVFNDLDGDIVRFFRVLRHPEKSRALAEALWLTPFARSEFEVARRTDLAEIECDIEAARLLVVRSFMGHGTDGTHRCSATGFRAASNRAAPRDWQNYPGCLRAVCERLQGVVIEQKPAAEILVRHDSERTLHYVDPPYLKETLGRRRHGYRHEMDERDHRALADVLQDLRGTVVLSGYASALYDQDLYAGWYRIERDARADGSGKRVEVLWSNRPFPQRQGLFL